VLSRAEVAAVLAAPISLKARTLLMTAYATGLRVSELGNLRGCDIDSSPDRMGIRVVTGKGGHDRYSLLYKERAASIECTSAHLRNRGLQRFNVRGLCKARAVLLWHALAHNLKRMMALNFAFAV
jgi:site-specific recombinase XerD